MVLLIYNAVYYCDVACLRACDIMINAYVLCWLYIHTKRNVLNCNDLKNNIIIYIKRDILSPSGQRQFLIQVFLVDRFRHSKLQQTISHKFF
jgi:hypothetical protein